MHANFSNEVMRTAGEEVVFTKICEEFGKNIERHISVYGADNDQRLTGDHETQSIDTFSYGISDRGASIRIPYLRIPMVGLRLEDRRTAQRRPLQSCSGYCENNHKRSLKDAKSARSSLIDPRCARRNHCSETDRPLRFLFLRD